MKAGYYDPCPAFATFDGLAIDWVQKQKLFVNPPFGKAMDIQHGLRVVNTVKGLQFILDKLQKVQSGFVYTQKDLVDAEKDMAKMQSLFQRMIEFIDSKESIKSLRM